MANIYQTVWQDIFEVFDAIKGGNVFGNREAKAKTVLRTET